MFFHCNTYQQYIVRGLLTADSVFNNNYLRMSAADVDGFHHLRPVVETKTVNMVHQRPHMTMLELVDYI